MDTIVPHNIAKEIHKIKDIFNEFGDKIINIIHCQKQYKAQSIELQKVKSELSFYKEILQPFTQHYSLDNLKTIASHFETEVTALFSLIYKPTIASDIIGLADPKGKRIVTIAEENNLFKDQYLVKRIPRTYRPVEDKWSTTVLFSIMGLLTIYSIQKKEQKKIAEDIFDKYKKSFDALA